MRLNNLELHYKELTLRQCITPERLGSYFSEEICRRSFSDGKAPSVTEIDYFYEMKAGDEIIGFFRVMDLFFESTIELHGSYGYKDKTHLRSYLVLSRRFVSSILEIFPARRIKTLVQQDNTATLHFVDWIGFRKTGVNDDPQSRLVFELDRVQFNSRNKELCNLITMED